MRLQNKIGMRTIKTGLAVTLCCIFTRFAVDNMFYCATACVVTMQDTIKTSFNMGWQRVLGTIIGCAVGFLLVLVVPANPILCGIGIMIVIKICDKLKLSSIVVASVGFFSLYLGYIRSAPLHYLTQRAIDTSVGVVVGLIINYVIARPNYYNNTMNEFKNIKNLCEDSLKNIAFGNKQLNMHVIEEEIKLLQNVYSKLIDELKYSNKRCDLENIDKSLELCRKIYFHIKCIELLEKELFLNECNHKKLQELYENENIALSIKEDQCPVFNFHLSKIIDKITMLERLIEVSN